MDGPSAAGTSFACGAPEASLRLTLNESGPTRAAMSFLTLHPIHNDQDEEDERERPHRSA